MGISRGESLYIHIVIGMGKDDSIILFFLYSNSNNFDCLYSYENNGENIFEINTLSCLLLFARKLNEIDLS